MHNSSLNSLTNPHPKPLPQGWSEHFDTARKIWYYVDLDSVPPRISLVHPTDGVSQGHDQLGRASVLPRALSTTPSSSDTTATSAQRLYATSHFTSTSRPSVSILESIVHSARTTQVDTSLPPTQASLPLPSPSLSESEHLQPHCRSRRLRESRQITHTFLSLSPFSAPLSMADSLTLYNPAVQTSTSAPPTFNSFKPQYGRGPKVIRASLRTNALPPTPADGSNGLTVTSITSHTQATDLYSGVTEDNIFLMPTHDKVSSAEQRAILIDEVLLSPVSPTQSVLQQPIASSSFTRSTDQVIFQPRPIKSLQGVSASFQDQLREISQPTPSLEEEQLKNATRKTPLFKRFSVGLIKAGKPESDKEFG